MLEQSILTYIHSYRRKRSKRPTSEEEGSDLLFLSKSELNQFRERRETRRQTKIVELTMNQKKETLSLMLVSEESRRIEYENAVSHMVKIVRQVQGVLSTGNRNMIENSKVLIYI